MLYILIAIGVLLVILGAFSKECADFLFGLGMFIFIASLTSLLIVGGAYNYRASTADSRLAVLEEQNQVVLNQIEPLVQQALNYESSTYKDLKLDAAKIIAFTQLYPDLKANDFLNKQIEVILTNQKEIKQLKLDKASLNAYHFWLWTPKVN
jgi:hypothetical protein